MLKEHENVQRQFVLLCIFLSEMHTHRKMPYLCPFSDYTEISISYKNVPLSKVRIIQKNLISIKNRVRYDNS